MGRPMKNPEDLTSPRHLTIGNLDPDMAFLFKTLASRKGMTHAGFLAYILGQSNAMDEMRTLGWTFTPPPQSETLP